jgi:hypothetical protein
MFRHRIGRIQKWKLRLGDVALAILSLDPDGAALGTTPTITLRGRSFKNGALIYFDEILADNIAFVTPRIMTCNTQVQTEISRVDVKIVNPDGEEFTLENGFAHFFLEEFDDFEFPAIGSIGSLQFGIEEFDNFEFPFIGVVGSLQFGIEEFNDFVLPVLGQKNVLQFGVEEFDDFT